MNERLAFNPLQAQQVAEAFMAENVDYLFIGKSGAILLGYPGTTQDVDVFPAKTTENGLRIVTALGKSGFDIDEKSKSEIIRGKDFVQIKTGPFDLVLIFAPDGIENYEEAKARAVHIGIFPVANLRDIIASKKACGRTKDRLDLHLLELFRVEFEAHNT